LKIKYTWENTARTLLNAIGVSSQIVTNGQAPKRNVDTTPHRSMEFPIGISHFATHCVQNAHALIISHRTKIIQPIDVNNPYVGMLDFLNSFTDPKYEVDIANGIKKSLLIFVVDIGGNHIDGLNAKVLSNYLALQSFLKAIFLLPPNEDRSFINPDSTPSAIIRAHNPDASIPPTMHGQYWHAHRYLINELMRRVVIIVKNYDNYIQRISDIENGFPHPPMIKNGFIPDKHIIYDGPDFRREFNNLLPNHILRQKTPPLDYLNSNSKCNKEWIEKKSTNFVGSDAEAFGLFSTVKFDDFNNSAGKKVECFAFDKKSGECLEMPLDERKSFNGTTTLFKDGIEDSMAVTCMAATHYLFDVQMANETYEINHIWPDYKNHNRSRFKWAYYLLLKEYYFRFFTIPQYLAQPVLFPDEIFSNNLKEI